MSTFTLAPPRTAVWEDDGRAKCGTVHCGFLLAHAILVQRQFGDGAPRRLVPLFGSGFLETPSHDGPLWRLTPNALERVQAGERPHFDRSFADTRAEGGLIAYTGHSVLHGAWPWPGMEPGAGETDWRMYAARFPAAVACPRCARRSTIEPPGAGVRPVMLVVDDHRASARRAVE